MKRSDLTINLNSTDSHITEFPPKGDRTMVQFCFIFKAPLYYLLLTFTNSEQTYNILNQRAFKEIPKSAFQTHLQLLTVYRPTEFDAKEVQKYISMY